MPIYTDKIQATQYKVVTQIDIRSFEKLLNIFKKAKNTFPYKDKYVFLKSIELDEAGKSLQFYGLKVATDELLGTDLSKVQDKFPYISKFYNDPKLCINDYNYIMMMEALIKEANRLIPKRSSYLFDIVGSWTNGKVIILKKK